MKPPYVTKSKTASLPELRDQLRDARTSHADALSAVTQQQASFDELGDDSAAKALAKARDAAALAGEHVARAERLVAAAEEREAALDRQRKEEEADRLARDVALPNPRTAELLEAELAAWKRVVDIRVERRALHASLEERNARYRHLCSVLSRDAGLVLNLAPADYTIRVKLRELAESMSRGDERADVIMRELLRT